jgi:antitoxin component of MazEF toxin-antitoxin module
MIEFEVILRKWGRSLGMVVPNDIVIKENLKEGSSIKVMVKNRYNPVKATFGKLKLKESTDKIMREVDREGWDE